MKTSKFGSFDKNLLPAALFSAEPWFWPSKYDENAISQERMIRWGCLTPHFVQKPHVSISVWYNVYTLQQEKWLKLTFWLKMAEISPKSISREPLIAWLSRSHHFNRKIQFSICVSYNVYPLAQQEWLKLTFWLKMAEISPKINISWTVDRTTLVDPLF